MNDNTVDTNNDNNNDNGNGYAYVRGSHLSKTTCLRHVFFNKCE